MSISITRLSGGNTPADGSDPRTFPAIWNATATLLEANVGVGGASVTTSDTAPVSPADGDMWWKSDEGKLYVYYDDGTTSQWVDAAGPTVAVQSTAPTGFEGQLWLDDTDGSMYVYYVDPGASTGSWIGAVSRSGGILQVVSTEKTTQFTTTSGTYVDITGMSATITPRSTSSKILVLVSMSTSMSQTAYYGHIQLLRGATQIAKGTDGTASNQTVSAWIGGGTWETDKISITHLDSPNTTSSVTYKLQALAENTRTFYVNRMASSANFGYSSSITLIEVAG